MKPLPPDNTATASERYLAGLCRRTFLRLWSYPSLYRDQRKGGAGDGKELCDLLVVFDDRVLLFSDKDCQFPEGGDMRTAWARWYRKAVLAAAKQVTGAERWIRTSPNRLFLDRQCTQPFLLTLPSSPRFHRVVTCRGASAKARGVFDGNGTLLVTSDPLGHCEKTPFRVGARSGSGDIFHVFDEVALDAVFSALDTVSDFCAYLDEREAFLAAHNVLAAGEEELLGYYLANYSTAIGRHTFSVQRVVSGESPTLVTIDEGFWRDWQHSDACHAKQEADQVSYSWDSLVDKFAFHLVTETQEFATHHAPAEMEPALRWMAREPRTRRRLLARSLIQAMQSTGAGQMRRQLILPSGSGDPYWVLLVFPRPDSLALAEYREARRDLLAALCKIVKFVRPEALDIVGLAVTNDPVEMSEDCLYLDARVWNSELEAEAKAFHELTGAFSGEPTIKRVERTIPSDG